MICSTGSSGKLAVFTPRLAGALISTFKSGEKNKKYLSPGVGPGGREFEGVSGPPLVFINLSATY